MHKGYCVESIKNNPDHFRTGMIEIVESSAPQEFKDGEEIEFIIEDLQLRGRARTENGDLTYFTLQETHGEKLYHHIITGGDCHAELPYRLVKYIKNQNHPQYADIEDFCIRYVI